jgi:hypothetical protein
MKGIRGMAEPGQSWTFLMSDAGYEHLEVVDGDGRVAFEGWVRGGLLTLDLGDRVRFVVPGGRRYRMFALVLHRGRPAIQFGMIWGPQRAYWFLDALPFIPGLTYRGKARRSRKWRGEDYRTMRLDDCFYPGMNQPLGPGGPIEVVVPFLTNRLGEIMEKLAERQERRTRGDRPAPVPAQLPAAVPVQPAPVAA